MATAASRKQQLLCQLSVSDGRDVKAMLVQLGYVEEDKPLLPGVSVRAASVEKLASLAVNCFGKL